MGEKRIGDGSFADAFVAPGVGRNARLDRIEDLFNWSRFEKLLKPMRSALDPEATWTRQYGRSTFGYKAHIAVDQFSCLIRQAVLTPVARGKLPPKSMRSMNKPFKRAALRLRWGRAPRNCPITPLK